MRSVVGRRISAPPNPMIKLTIKRSGKLNTRGLTPQNVINAVNMAWREAIQEFVRVAVELISVDTGMSAASLLPLADVVQFRNAAEAIIYGKGPKMYRTAHPERAKNFPTYYYGVYSNRRPYKSWDYGEDLGGRAYTVEFAHQHQPYLYFRFHIAVLQHFLNEDMGKHWRSMTGAKQAMIATFNARIAEYRTRILQGEIFNG